MNKQTAVVDMSSATVVRIEAGDAMPTPGFAVVDITSMDPQPEVGWVLFNGQLMTAADRDNLPYLAQLAALDTQSGMPRLQRECLLELGAKNARLLDVEAKAAAARGKLKK